ncbi:MAG: NAD(P)(+) transhydrogenase (Re/Si-specific) subunit beta [Capsulimonadaceae bacterium]|nr:NAD(P)(+) transhydrogenase (Re/Si-specific) subunit beta [Capsulimonadaceae bacterium]
MNNIPPIVHNVPSIEFAYLITAFLFYVALKYMNTPATAKLGNRIAMVGMLITVVGVFIGTDSDGLKLVNLAPAQLAIIVSGLVIGGLIGAISAKRVKMTAMPQMVAIFNGAGGATAALVAVYDLHHSLQLNPVLPPEAVASIFLSVIIGCLSFTGSLVAFGKLQELISGRPITWPGANIMNIAGFVAVIGCMVVAFFNLPGFPPTTAFAIVAVVSFFLGFLFVLPIGGADMPVVISLLNAFTGIAVAAGGFALGNNALVVAGAFVGASGTLLTLLMGKAMNRPITNVLFGAFGAVDTTAAAGGGGAAMNVRSASADDVGTMLAYASQVIIVPGYGMAVAQAQHAVKDLADQLEAHDVTVKYAIHPVAGRMPGHMNVLLAEADVPYPALFDMEDINPQFSQTDVALVIGANDVTNPAARADKSSPIYGMPILDVDKAQNVVVLKRSMRSGFAGIPNPLYEDPKTVMLFGDAKESVEKLAAVVKSL